MTQMQPEHTEGAEVIPFPTTVPLPQEREQVETDTAVRTEVREAPGTSIESVEKVIEGEIVEETPHRRVDLPEVLADTGSWLEQRRAYMAEASPIVPPYLRDREAFTAAARFVASYYAHVGAWHATRSPLYLLRLMARGPRGMGRAGLAWLRWVADLESAPLRKQAAGANQTGEYMMLSREHTKRVKPRLITSAIVGVPVTAVMVLAVATLPTWAVAPMVGAVLALFGLGGGQPDRPLIDRYVTGAADVQRPLDSAEVTEALEAIGIKGALGWPHPIQTDGPGWRAELDLPRGYLAEKVMEKRSDLAAAMRRPLGCVWPETDPEAHPGRLVLWVAKQDPAKAPRRLWPLMSTGKVNLFDDIPFGFDPRGRLIPLSLMYTNILIGGLPGSGKTSATMVIALSAALDPRSELWVHELKGSGDLDSVRGVCHRYVSGDDDEHCEAALDALRALLKELKRRKQIVADLPLSDVPNGRKVSKDLAGRKELGLHPLVAIFDEAHTLFEHEDHGKEAADLAGQLIKKARAYGIILVFTTQKPDAKSLPTVVSDNVSTRFALALVGQQPNDMVLGTSAYKRGVRATMFDPKKDAGTGWLSKSAHDNQIVRAAFITQEEAVAIGQRAHALRTAAGTLTGHAAGEDITPEDPTTLVDHLLAVWPDGEDAVHSHRLVEALAAYRPDLYGTWTEAPMDEMTEEQAREARTARSTALSQGLAPFKVKTRQITIRECCGGAKGIRRKDLPE